MKRKIAIKLTEHRLGRAALHLCCLARDRKWAWHLAGLRRELFGRARSLAVFAAGFALVLGCLGANPPDYYTEPFRPQYHFTPEKNWMNDPNGLVYYHGEYNLFYQYNPFGIQWGHMSWGHAVSGDLVHWKHLPLALPEADGIMCFSGSAVVDWHNTSGFGKNGQPPLVAIYTGMRVADGRQFQCIAYSNDEGLTWTKYANNPVLDIGSDNFRDPKVQWYAPGKCWVMVLALSAEHKVQFYNSKDLKHWTLLSEFGPAGATGGVWECPDLFQLPVVGTKQKRWVLTVNIGSGSVAGGSGGQYFVGQFDGTRFNADSDSQLKPTPAVVPVGKLLADFEQTNYVWLPGGVWTSTGTAFGGGPAQGALANQQPVTGYRGHGLVNSYNNGDGSTGTLTSPEFEISRPYLNFLIGGGSQKQTRMDLLLDGKVVRTASGQDDERLAWRFWDVRQFENQKAILRIVDEATDGWGHISVDQIMLANAPAHSALEPALWFDYGPDYYASVSWNDIPPSDGRRLWIGWMSNWQYGQDVPTSPWRSAFSIPRELGLCQTSEGIRLVQKPVQELESLRAKYFRFHGGSVSAAQAWLAKNQIHGDQLELIVDFAPQNFGVEGVEVLKGSNGETTIGVDRDAGTVFVDRRHSGAVDFNPKFPGIYSAPLPMRRGVVQLHVFVDSCSVEVFAAEGTEVFSVLVFPSKSSFDADFFGPKAAQIRSVDVWTLKSSWR